MAPAGAASPGTKLDGEAMRQPDARRSGVDDSRFRREITRRVSGNRAGHAIVVALHGLIDALRERQVRNARHRHCAARRPRRLAPPARLALPWAGQWRPMGKACCCSSRSDRRASCRREHCAPRLPRLAHPGPVCVEAKASGNQRKLFPQRVDELVDFGESVPSCRPSSNW